MVFFCHLSVKNIKPFNFCTTIWVWVDLLIFYAGHAKNISSMVIVVDNRTDIEECEAVKQSLQCVTNSWDLMVCSHKTSNLCLDQNQKTIRVDEKYE